MSSNRKVTEGVQTIAAFDDQAVPFTDAADIDQAGKLAQSMDEGIHNLANFTDDVQPLDESGAIEKKSNGQSGNSEQ